MIRPRFLRRTLETPGRAPERWSRPSTRTRPIRGLHRFGLRTIPRWRNRRCSNRDTPTKRKPPGLLPTVLRSLLPLPKDTRGKNSNINSKLLRPPLRSPSNKLRPPLRSPSNRRLVIPSSHSSPVRIPQPPILRPRSNTKRNPLSQFEQINTYRTAMHCINWKAFGRSNTTRNS